MANKFSFPQHIRPFYQDGKRKEDTPLRIDCFGWTRFNLRFNKARSALSCMPVVADTSDLIEGGGTVTFDIRAALDSISESLVAYTSESIAQIVRDMPYLLGNTHSPRTKKSMKSIEEVEAEIEECLKEQEDYIVVNPRTKKQGVVIGRSIDVG